MKYRPNSEVENECRIDDETTTTYLLGRLSEEGIKRPTKSDNSLVP